MILRDDLEFLLGSCCCRCYDRGGLRSADGCLDFGGDGERGGLDYGLAVDDWLRVVDGLRLGLEFGLRSLYRERLV